MHTRTHTHTQVAPNTSLPRAKPYELVAFLLVHVLSKTEERVMFDRALPQVFARLVRLEREDEVMFCGLLLRRGKK